MRRYYLTLVGRQNGNQSGDLAVATRFIASTRCRMAFDFQVQRMHILYMLDNDILCSSLICPLLPFLTAQAMPVDVWSSSISCRYSDRKSDWLESSGI